MARAVRPQRTSQATKDAASTSDGIDATRPRWALDPRFWAAGIVLLVCVAFAPLFTSDFTNIDDPATIARNPELNPPTLAGLIEFWDPRKPLMDLYVPVTYTVWSAVAALAWVPTPDAAGIHLNPWMFHGTNVALHALSALVVFQILRLLVRPVPVAAAGALLFALHPLQVEAVGWASGTKDVLYGLLSLIAIWAYLHSAIPDTRDCSSNSHPPSTPPSTPGRPGPGPGAENDSKSPFLEFAPRSPFRSPWYWLATAAFVLAMLSKPTAVVTPLIAATLDLLVLRRPLRLVARNIWPWLLLVVPVLIEGRLAQPALHRGDFVVPLHLRPLIATDALAFYIGKLFWPAHLGFIYNRSPQAVIAHGWLWWTWIVPLAAALAALAPLWMSARRDVPRRLRFRSPQRRGAADGETASAGHAVLPGEPAPTVIDPSILAHHPTSRLAGSALPAAALAIFFIGVLPVLGFVPFDFQQFSTTADHYLYLAMLGPALAAAFAMAALWHKRPAGELESGNARGSPGPRIQSPHFRFFPFSRFTFSRFTFSRFTFSRFTFSRFTFSRFTFHVFTSSALCIILLAALGVRTFFQARHWHDSFSLLEHAIEVNPWSPQLYDNLSKAYADASLPDEARRWDERSVRRWPGRAAGHLDLASDFLALGRPDQAEPQLQAALRLDPGLEAARQQLADLQRQRAATSRPTR